MDINGLYEYMCTIWVSKLMLQNTSAIQVPTKTDRVSKPGTWMHSCIDRYVSSNQYPEQGADVLVFLLKISTQAANHATRLMKTRSQNFCV